MADHDEEYFLGKLDGWIADQSGNPTGFDIVQTGNFEILVGYVIRLVGSASLAAPIKRSGDSPTLDSNQAPLANPAMRIFARLALAWALSPEEKMALLNIASSGELAMLERSRMNDVPAASIERLAVLLDIFKNLNTLLPVPSRADGWIRRPSSAELFGGRTPLTVMCESPDGIRDVQRYLNAEALSG